jgi:hypothetical protein
MRNRFALLASFMLLSLSPVVARAADDPLESGFHNPPQAAKPQTWWHWMNGNVTKDGITADLEAMKRVGLGGAQIFYVSEGIPAGPVRLNSPQWIEMVKFAASEADRLGLELCVHNCAGWSSSGGPWNTPEHAMQTVTISQATAKGPSKFDQVLPQPTTKLDFYRNIAVLAFPTPPGELKAPDGESPKVTASAADADTWALVDHNARTSVTLPAPKADAPQWLQLEFAQPRQARAMVLTGTPNAAEISGIVQSSDDGQNFKDLRSFTLPKSSPPISVSFGDKAVTSRFYRILINHLKGNAPTIALAEAELTDRLIVENLPAKGGFSGAFVNDPQGDPADAPDESIRRETLVDLTDKLQPDGHLSWDVPEGDWTILRIGYTPTGRTNHPAPPDATGPECDKFSKEALDAHWAGMMQPIIDALGPLAGKTLDNCLIDSYEVAGQNWTPKMRDEFKARRGYDPLPYLPALSGRIVESPQVTERFLWDMRRTIADLFAENYYGHFAELCHEHGLKAEIEPYTGPYESLLCGKPADTPMGEFWAGGTGGSSIKLASSVGHIYGKPVIGSESFTARPDAQGRWQEDPYSLKALGDFVYTEGVNRFIYHRFAMQPWLDRFPGMTMGQWGFHFDRTNTWFEKSTGWVQYCTRCQYLLQQGRFVADVAYFCGESAPVEQRQGNPRTPQGYDWDSVNADALMTATVKDGRLTLASRMSYAVLVLPPNDPLITVKTLQKIHDLVSDGATVVGMRPRRSPSLQDYPKCDDDVKKLADDMWGNIDGKEVTQHQFGKGRVILANQSLGDVLTNLNLKADFEFDSSHGSKLVYIHRALDNGVEMYFVSNQQDKPDDVECTFRVSGKMPELWHPDTGVIEPAAVYRQPDDRITMPMRFDPSGSVFVIFRRPMPADHVVLSSQAVAVADAAPVVSTPATTRPAFELSATSTGEVELLAFKADPVQLTMASGKSLQARPGAVPDPIALAGPWEVRFPPNWGAPASVTFDKLISWPDFTDDGVRYFSGTATYVKDIDIPADLLGPSKVLFLDLGRVKNIADVKLNDQPLGILWKPPFRADISSIAKAGSNHLEIQITNNWPNRLIGDEQLPADRKWNGKQLAEWPQWVLDDKPSPTGRFTFTTWHHWNKTDKLQESGLIGPVTLVPAVRVKAE